MILHILQGPINISLFIFMDTPVAPVFTGHGKVHQLGRREGAPRPGHEPAPSPRAGHLTGAGHLLPMRGGVRGVGLLVGFQTMGMSPKNHGQQMQKMIGKNPI